MTLEQIKIMTCGNVDDGKINIAWEDIFGNTKYL